MNRQHITHAVGNGKVWIERRKIFPETVRGTIAKGTRKRSTILRKRAGSTLIEMALFLGIVAIMSSSLVGAYISVQEARIRQQFISEVEQRGAQVLGTITKNIRTAEQILSPEPGIAADTLALQMTLNNVNPTIVMRTSEGNVLLIEKTGTAALLGSRVTASDVQFRNVAGSSVAVSFDLNVVLPTVPRQNYTAHFEGVGTLSPKKMDNGGCEPCPPPTCADGVYEWHYCDNGVCTVTPSGVEC